MAADTSSSFFLLDEKVQKWIWKQGWNSLHDIQEEAIDPILKRNVDVVISSATASGKTEAAFLPIATHLIQNKIDSYQVLYISPLKALINDQYRRLEDLCKISEINVTPWHGDISGSKKANSFKNPQGILLITPESLESLFVNRSAYLSHAFNGLDYVVIDELHSFIGTERGCQLQSLIFRLINLIKKDVPRIALSATLGNVEKAAGYLRPDGDFPHKIIKSKTLTSDLKLQLKGYIELPPDSEDSQPTSSQLIADDLFSVLRGTSNLIFANSRQNTEYYSDLLIQQCEKDGVPNEFFPHHGNLSKEIRLEVEQRLQKGELPTNAVCTMTLELGIDIGSVVSIAQIGSPFSVSSIRQRLGRSGRRGEASILRIYISENKIDANVSIIDKFRPELIQSVALVNLLLNKWYEPPDTGLFHLSTLVQQILSVIAQYGGFQADQGWGLLCQNGFFRNITPKLFAILLKNLGEKDIINQDHDGTIVIGEIGERIVNHYTFYAAFSTPEEYRLEVEGKTLGTLPIDSPLSNGSYLIFAGRRWEVLDINEESKTIQLKHAIGGKVPKFSGQGMMVHDTIREEMKRVLMSSEHPIYLDKAAIGLLDEARRCFNQYKLEKEMIVDEGNSVYIFPWQGDKTLNSFLLEMRELGLKAWKTGFLIKIEKCNKQELKTIVNQRIQGEEARASDLASTVGNKEYNKYDYLLGEELLCKDFASRSLSTSGSWQLFQDLYQNL
jgi:ATP-dependent helicase Lhr and Lhr-like helicase